MTHKLMRAAITVAAAFGLSVAAQSAFAQMTPIRFSLDWNYEGPSAPFLLALERGYFAEEGLSVTIDNASVRSSRSIGSPPAPTTWASATSTR